MFVFIFADRNTINMAKLVKASTNLIIIKTFFFLILNSGCSPSSNDLFWDVLIGIPKVCLGRGLSYFHHCAVNNELNHLEN